MRILVFFLVAAPMMVSAQAITQAQQNDLYNKFIQMERRLQAIEQKTFTGTNAGTGASTADLELRLQEIENESATLYGAVEQLGNAVERLAMRVESLAKDLELRLQDLESALADNQAMLSHHAAAEAPEPAPAIEIPESLQTPDDITPEQLYKQAYDALIAAQYPQSQKWLESFIERFPEHELGDNAYYWLGEVYLVQGDARKAAVTFKQGLEKFPEGRKAPGNLLKMGTAFDQLGQKNFATSAWQRVVDEYPGTPEAARAETFLNSAS